LGLEVAAVETTTGATGRLFMKFERSDVPTVLIDLGSTSSDLTIVDKSLVVTGSAPGGGDSFTAAISQKLGISHDEAHIVKTKYGLGASKKQKEITEALAPIISTIIKEIKQMIRYYEERSGSKENISQIVTMGGGANMPGLAEYLTDTLRLPVRLCDPWHHLSFKSDHKPGNEERSMYVTVAGLAAVTPKEIAG
jgi:Tfp pilus assembly PilM family ATPase